MWDLDDAFWGDFTEDWDEELENNDKLALEINDLKTKYESEIQRLQNELKSNQIRLETGKKLKFFLLIFFPDIFELEKINKKLIQGFLDFVIFLIFLRKSRFAANC